MAKSDKKADKKSKAASKVDNKSSKLKPKDIPTVRSLYE
jgi:hypothetical protein